MKITVIQRERDQHKARVAAYCRVSTTLENQEDSYEEQVRYYTGYIQANEDWEFAGIYSDEKSGTKASNRDGFQNLIRDAIDGKVDRILVKSVSRFSRNMVECQKYVKILKGNGVDVRFEKENLDTADPSCTMMFSFLAAIAQDESRSISENVKWAYRERFKRGEYNLGNTAFWAMTAWTASWCPTRMPASWRSSSRCTLKGRRWRTSPARWTPWGSWG